MLTHGSTANEGDDAGSRRAPWRPGRAALGSEDEQTEPVIAGWLTFEKNVADGAHVKLNTLNLTQQCFPGKEMLLCSQNTRTTIIHGEENADIDNMGRNCWMFQAERKLDLPVLMKLFLLRFGRLGSKYFLWARRMTTGMPQPAVSQVWS